MTSKQPEMVYHKQSTSKDRKDTKSISMLEKYNLEQQRIMQPPIDHRNIPKIKQQNRIFGQR